MYVCVCPTKDIIQIHTQTLHKLSKPFSKKGHKISFSPIKYQNKGKLLNCNKCVI